MKGTIKRFAVIALAAFGLGSCGVASEGTGLFDSSFWDTGTLFEENDRGELGLAEMAKGNYAVAEAHFEKALKVNPKNVHALMGLGILYQNTGRLVKSREMYEAILAIRPSDQDQMVVWKEFSTRPVSEIASVNLALLESEGVMSATRPAPRGVSGGPADAAILGRTAPSADLASRTRAAGLAPTFSSDEANVISRFKTLIALRDQGLITIDEYNARRQANIGALLPLTSPPPAAGLNRSVPSTEQITGRLRAIGRALEMRAITVGQHSAERTMILDAMMPSAPVSVANPGAPPKGLMAAADAVRKLEALQSIKLITTDEYAKERAAIERAMQPAGTSPSIAAASPPTSLDASRKGAGPLPAIHLSSYRSRKAADRGWAQLRRAHKALLAGFRPEVSKINLGPGKGIFYRLKVGPLESEDAAIEICRKLKRRRQYCEPSYLNSG